MVYPLLHPVWFLLFPDAINQLTVVDSGRAGCLAGQAAQAAIKVVSGSSHIQCAAGNALDQRDAAPWRVSFVQG